VSSYDWHHGYTDCTVQAVSGNRSVEKCQQERSRSPHPSCSAVEDYNHRPQIARHSSSHTATLRQLPSWQWSDDDNSALAARQGSSHTETLSQLPSWQRSDDDNSALAARQGSSHTETLSQLPSWQRSDKDSVSQRYDTSCSRWCFLSKLSIVFCLVIRTAPTERLYHRILMQCLLRSLPLFQVL